MQGWDPRGLGTVTSRAISAATRGGGGEFQAQCLSREGPNNRSFAGPAERMRTHWRFRGPRAGSCALCPKLPENRPLKLPWFPPPLA